MQEDAPGDAPGSSSSSGHSSGSAPGSGMEIGALPQGGGAACGPPEGFTDMNVEDLKIIRKYFLGVDITLVFSRERVKEVAEKFKLKPGTPFYLTAGWGMSKKMDQRLAWKRIGEEGPELVIGSPSFTVLSRFQEHKRAQHEHDAEWRGKQAKEWAQAVRRIDFCMRIYRYQLVRGRHFLHEHPCGASSSNLDSVRQLSRDQRVQWTRADQCEYELKTYSDEGVEMPAQKSICFMTTSWALVDELSQR